MNYYVFYRSTTWAGSLIEQATIKARSRKDAIKQFRKNHPRMDRVFCIKRSQIKCVNKIY